MKSVFIAATNEQAVEVEALEGNWVDPDPLICLFHCIIDYPCIRDSFMQQLNSMDHVALKNRNSEGSHEKSVLEDIATVWSDPTFTVTTESFTKDPYGLHTTTRHPIHIHH